MGRNDERLSDETEANISHYIPSVELRGSRAEQLQKLDTLIVHLDELRKRLAGDAPIARGSYARPSPYLAGQVWPWLAAGIFSAVLLAVLLLAAKSCA